MLLSEAEQYRAERCDDRGIGNELEESDFGLMEVLSGHLLGGAWVNHNNLSHNSW
jgi:hypothetical protein